MTNFFSNFNVLSLPFWLGLLSGLFLLWILYRLRNYFPKILKRTQQSYSNIKESISSNTEFHLRNDIHRFSQKQHLAAALFPLDDIVIEPKVLTPLIQSQGSIELSFTDSVSLSVPYIPDWPELAAIYKASTMNLIEALQGNANIILAGHPGCGKTVALAWMSSCIARNIQGLGTLADLLPLYIHATDIPNLFNRTGRTIEKKEEANDDDLSVIDQLQKSRTSSSIEVVELFVKAISRYASSVTLPRLPRIIQSALDSQRAILILDRVDELPPNQATIITGYIKILLQKYPKLRVIIGMSYDNLAELPTLGFSLLGLAAWTEVEQKSLLERWIKQWSKWIAPISKIQARKVRWYYLKSWLSANNVGLKPLEFTLKIWAALNGDILGSDGPSAIEAYCRRTTNNISDSQPVMEQFALQLAVEMAVISNPYIPDRLISEYDVETQSLTPPETGEQVDMIQPSPVKLSIVKNIHGIDMLTNNGLLVDYHSSHYGFSHQVFFGYLAGKALSKSGVIRQLQKQPSWTGKNLALYYLSRFGDVTSLVQDNLQDDDVIHTNHLLISRWLQVAPKNRPWRTIILRTLTSILQKERDTTSLAAKIITALALSGDVGVSLYFRKLMKSEHPILKQLAVLGCGILADKVAIDDVQQILQEQSPSSIRTASLALAAIGDKRSSEILAYNLLNGDETSRRYAAEALANNTAEGHQALQEGSGLEDLLVRRAVVYGLIRINQPWALKIVENLQLEDKEWVVRNAAIQAFDELHRSKNYAPSVFPDLIESQWLIDYAMRIGTTVVPGAVGEDLVRKALTSGTQNEKLHAMDYFRSRCEPKSLDLIYTTYKNSSGDLRDLSYYVLWAMTIAGIKLPIIIE